VRVRARARAHAHAYGGLAHGSARAREVWRKKRPVGALERGEQVVGRRAEFGAEAQEREAPSAARVVGLSPIIAGRAVRGMADACLPAIGVETTAEGVGRHYGGRAEGGLLDGWLVHTDDQAGVPGAGSRPALEEATGSYVRTR